MTLRGPYPEVCQDISNHIVKQRAIRSVTFFSGQGEPEMIRMCFFVDVGRGSDLPEEATATTDGVRRGSIGKGISREWP